LRISNRPTSAGLKNSRGGSSGIWNAKRLRRLTGFKNNIKTSCGSLRESHRRTKRSRDLRRFASNKTPSEVLIGIAGRENRTP
jgi:hypothetical protein